MPANLVHQYSGELQAIMTAYLSGTSPQQFQQAGAAMANLAVDVATVVASDGAAEVAGAGTSATLDAVNSGLAKMGIGGALPVAEVSGMGAAATVVEQTASGIEWGGGVQAQGLPWEDYLAKSLPPEARLPANFQTFDFYDKDTETAISAKTLDTTTAAKVANPTQVYYSLKGNIDAAANFTNAKLSGVRLDASMISSRQLDVAVPRGTTPAQWTQIERAIEYGQSQGVTVKVSVIKGAN